VAKHDQNLSTEELRVNEYQGKFKSDFLKFCHNFNIEPSLGDLKAYSRIASPVNLYPVHDAQFYFYFCDPAETSNLNMNKDEFTDAKWLTIE
jgi:hypothetical protein